MKIHWLYNLYVKKKMKNVLKFPTDGRRIFLTMKYRPFTWEIFFISCFLNIIMHKRNVNWKISPYPNMVLNLVKICWYQNLGILTKNEQDDKYSDIMCNYLNYDGNKKRFDCIGIYIIIIIIIIIWINIIG